MGLKFLQACIIEVNDPDSYSEYYIGWMATK